MEHRVSQMNQQLVHALPTVTMTSPALTRMQVAQCAHRLRENCLCCPSSTVTVTDCTGCTSAARKRKHFAAVGLLDFTSRDVGAFVHCDSFFGVYSNCSLRTVRPCRLSNSAISTREMCHSSRLH